MKNYSITTLGCRVNQYESDALAELIKQNGDNVLDDGKKADLYIVNTCAVTAESERKSRQTVRRLAGFGKVAVIGCASQLHPNDYLNIENVVYVGGSENKKAAVCGFCDRCGVTDLQNPAYEKLQSSGMGGQFSSCRAYVKIQDGCSAHCSYCIIPKTRGRSRCREAVDIIQEVERLVGTNHREVVLTGIEIDAYNKKPLYELIKDISQVNGIKRIRLGSLSPNTISEKFLSELSQIPTFMPHFHISAQSGSDRILELMCRPYRREKLVSTANLIRKYFKDAQLSADIIAGFPGETEEDFAQSVSLINEMKLFHVHAFPYSDRSGTVASTMPNKISVNIKKQRVELLQSAADKQKEIIFASMQNSECKILVEKTKNGIATGHTESFLPVQASGLCEVGDIAKVYITSYDDSLTGNITEVFE